MPATRPEPQVPFSVVIPVATADASLIRRTLPSWLGIGTDDLVVVADEDSPPSLTEEVERVAKACGRSEVVRVVRAPKSHDWDFHQAYARRYGFIRAKHDSILTGDIDLIVRRNLGELTKGLGANRLGLASCIRLLVPQSPVLTLRSVSYLVKQKLIPPVFSGLYAFWRPYWLETEDDGIKRLGDARAGSYAHAGLGLLGEDTYLYVCMKRKYHCVQTNFIGGLSATRFVEDLPSEQFAWGRYMAATNTNALVALFASILFLYPHLLVGFLYEKRRPSVLADPFHGDLSLSCSRAPSLAHLGEPLKGPREKEAPGVPLLTSTSCNCR